jgi:Transglutaminase-like superfamily/Domain of unknown function (DUF4129)
MLPVSTSIFLPPKHSPAGADYIVSSEVRAPTEDDLRAVTMNDLDAMSALTKPRKSFPGDVADLAEQLTKDAPTPYEKALRLEAYFQSDLFTYNQNVSYEGSSHALEDFVLKRRQGFCEQFATAFAEMARWVGLPTRVAVGYQSQSGIGKDGRFHVKGADAHAWPEVWLGAEIGWFSFEPTKGRFDPTTGRGDKAAAGSTTPSSNTTPSTGSTATSVRPNNPTVPIDPKTLEIPPAQTANAKTSSTTPRVLLGIGIAIGVLLLLLVGTLIALTIAARRRTRKRRDTADTRRRVLGAWTEALERLTAAGVAARPSATSVEFALRHAPAHGAGGAGPPLMDLARLQTAAMFAPDPPSAADADAAWQHVDEIDAALRETVPRSERWITRLRIRRRDREPRIKRAKKQTQPEEVGVS